MKSSSTKPNDLVLRQALQENGHRYTDQRAAVFRHVARSRVHPTAEDVFLGVRTEVPGISLATVYKSLETLVNCGLAKKLTPPRRLSPVLWSDRAPPSRAVPGLWESVGRIR